MLIQQSVAHLKQNNMGYFQHMKFAIFHGLLCIFHGFQLIFHALIPAVFQTAGSKLINKLNKSFTEFNEYEKLKKQLHQFQELWQQKNK